MFKRHPRRPSARLILSAGALLLAGIRPAHADAPHAEDGRSFTAILGCDAPQGHVCFFTIFNGAGIPQTFLRALGGARTTIPVFGQDTYAYTVTVDTNYSTDPTCRAAIAAGAFCKTANLAPGFNH